jgi:NADH-quinone oxidoreductase subunit I
MADALAPVKGFAVTFKQLFKKPITQQYPEYKRPLYPRFRGRHRLNRYENGLEKCVGCSLCAAACPADCIRVVAAENTPELACPFDAITLGNEYEISEYSRADLIYTKDILLAEPIKRVPIQDPELYDTPIPYYKTHA